MLVSPNGITIISLSFRGDLGWVAPSWSVLSQVPFGQLVHSSTLVTTPPPFFGESQERGYHVGGPESHPSYKRYYSVVGATPVASKFNLPKEVVTVSMHCFSPPTWSEGVGEMASLSPSLVVGTTWSSVMEGLVAWGVIGSSKASRSVLATGTRWVSLSRWSGSLSWRSPIIGGAFWQC